jgi:hypothetical protein
VFAYVCICVNVCIYVYARKHVYVCAFMLICVRLCVYVRAHVFLLLYV